MGTNQYSSVHLLWWINQCWQRRSSVWMIGERHERIYRSWKVANYWDFVWFSETKGIAHTYSTNIRHDQTSWIINMSLKEMCSCVRLYLKLMSTKHTSSKSELKSKKKKSLNQIPIEMDELATERNKNAKRCIISCVLWFNTFFFFSSPSFWCRRCRLFLFANRKYFIFIHFACRQNV